MDRITRKTLKGDRFATEVTHSVEYIAEHRRQSILYGGIIAAVLAIGLGSYFYWQHRNTLAHDALYHALETYRATVSQQEQAGHITFRTAAEKYNKALKDFGAVTKDFPRTTEGKIARYYIGLVYYEMGNVADAQKQLEKLLAERHDNVLALARFTLAEVYISQGKDAEALKIYDYLMKHPTDMVPEGRVQLAMARYLRPRKPEEARKLLQELLKRPGPIAAAAANMLRDLAQPQ